uniref:Uncharacterized protein n=1 Tax=Trichobilharzia regenti TaxID=157069 RepID=A0AA85KF12_TRIRE|nr:unnamed protein product [Trichobilharzia regenti]
MLVQLSLRMLIIDNDSNKSSFRKTEESLSATNEESSVINYHRRIQKNFIDISKYDKRVIVFSVVLIIIAVIIVIAPHFFGSFDLNPVVHLIMTMVFCVLAIASGYLVVISTYFREKLITALITLLIYGICCSVCLSIFFTGATLLDVILGWVASVVICACGVFLGAMIKKDLTEKFDIFLVVCVVIFILTGIAMVILIADKIIRAVLTIAGIGIFVEVFLVSVIVGQLIFKSGHLHIRDDWSLGVLGVFTLVITAFVIAEVAIYCFRIMT